MAEKLGDRIVLVGRLLTALKSVGGAAYARTSELQAAAVKGLLLQASLSLEQSTEIVESIVASLGRAISIETMSSHLSQQGLLVQSPPSPRQRLPPGVLCRTSARL